MRRGGGQSTGGAGPPGFSASTGAGRSRQQIEVALGAAVGTGGSAQGIPHVGQSSVQGTPEVGPSSWGGGDTLDADVAHLLGSFATDHIDDLDALLRSQPLGGVSHPSVDQSVYASPTLQQIYSHPQQSQSLQQQLGQLPTCPSQRGNRLRVFEGTAVGPSHFAAPREQQRPSQEQILQIDQVQQSPLTRQLLSQHSMIPANLPRLIFPLGQISRSPSSSAMLSRHADKIPQTSPGSVGLASWPTLPSQISPARAFPRELYAADKPRGDGYQGIADGMPSSAEDQQAMQARRFQQQMLLQQQHQRQQLPQQQQQLLQQQGLRFSPSLANQMQTARLLSSAYIGQPSRSLPFHVSQQGGSLDSFASLGMGGQSIAETGNTGGISDGGRGFEASSRIPPLQFHRWSKEEDDILLNHVQKHGTRKWTKLRESGKLPGRDNKACCNRYRLLKKSPASGDALQNVAEESPGGAAHPLQAPAECPHDPGASLATPSPAPRTGIPMEQGAGRDAVGVSSLLPSGTDGARGGLLSPRPSWPGAEGGAPFLRGYSHVPEGGETPSSVGQTGDRLETASMQGQMAMLQELRSGRHQIGTQNYHFLGAKPIEQEPLRAKGSGQEQPSSSSFFRTKEEGICGAVGHRKRKSQDSQDEQVEASQGGANGGQEMWNLVYGERQLLGQLHEESIDSYVNFTSYTELIKYQGDQMGDKGLHGDNQNNYQNPREEADV